jgi:hypothetical protein
MARGPLLFKQADLVRAVKAVRTAGLEVERTEISPNGRIVLVHKPKDPQSREITNPYDAWKAANGSS